MAAPGFLEGCSQGLDALEELSFHARAQELDLLEGSRFDFGLDLAKMLGAPDLLVQVTEQPGHPLQAILLLRSQGLDRGHFTAEAFQIHDWSRRPQRGPSGRLRNRRSLFVNSLDPALPGSTLHATNLPFRDLATCSEQFPIRGIAPARRVRPQDSSGSSC